MSRRPPATARPMPVLADGTEPMHGDVVEHGDGTRGAIAWSAYGTAALVSARNDQPPCWATMVRHEVKPGVTAARWRRTSELRRVTAS